MPVPTDAIERNGNYLGTPNCHWLMQHSVYIPVHQHVSEKNMDKMLKMLMPMLANYNHYIKKLDRPVRLSSLSQDIQPLPLAFIRAKL